ncbi:hypothetical protein V1279_002014 [Bradyrhizobium sp. AZCC 1610]
MRYICEILGVPRFSSFSTQSGVKRKSLLTAPKSENDPIADFTPDLTGGSGASGKTMTPLRSHGVIHRLTCSPHIDKIIVAATAAPTPMIGQATVLAVVIETPWDRSAPLKPQAR